jgi:hypothetical protein
MSRRDVVWIDLDEGYRDSDALETALVKMRRRRMSFRGVRRNLELVKFGGGRLEIALALTNFF